MSDIRSAEPAHILLIDCPDRKGLVHAVTGVLYRHGLNAVENGEFVEPATDRFFMRTEFIGPVDTALLERELRDVLPAAARIRLAPRRRKDLVLLATREAHCLGDLLLRHAYGELEARILAVVSNHADLAPLVERFELPFHHVPHADLSRGAHEEALLAVLDDYRPEYLVLAKYMRVLTPAFIDRYPQRILNIHHSFLPAFVGARPYRQAYERGVKIIGATAHFVTPDLDEGPIIDQGVIPVNHTHSEREMMLAGRDVEKIVLARALKLVLEDRVFVCGNKTIIFG